MRCTRPAPTRKQYLKAEAQMLYHARETIDEHLLMLNLWLTRWRRGYRYVVRRMSYEDIGIMAEEAQAKPTHAGGCIRR
jgi:hypothetical protein